MYLIGRLILIACAALMAFCLVLLGMRFSVCAALICLVYVTKTGGLFKAKRFLFAHGTARWADSSDLRRAGMIGAKHGLMIGRLNEWGVPSLANGAMSLVNPFVGSLDACNRFLGALFRRPSNSAPIVRLSRSVHVAVFCPTSGGKTSGFAIPDLLDRDESAVIVNIKGDLYITAEHRRKVFGHRIANVDPWKLCSENPDSFNPLDFISKDDPAAIDRCRDLAEAVVIRTGREPDPHWNDAAVNRLTALIATVVYYGDADDRSFQTVSAVLASPEKMDAAIKLMCSSDAWEGMLARIGHQLTYFKDKEFASSMTTTTRHLQFLSSPLIAASTNRSTFDPSDLLTGKMTVFLTLPIEHLRSQSGLLRLWIGGMLNAVIRGGLQEHTRVTFMLDECASLGALPQLKDVVDKYRSFGIRAQFYFQSPAQVSECFPEGQDRTFLSNVTQVYFASNDNDTGEFISSRLGEETIIVERSSGGVSHARSIQTSDRDNDSHSTSRTDSENWAQQGRKLLKPEEVLALSPRTAITFAPGVPPICTTLTRYYENQPNFWGYLKRALKTAAIAIALFVGFGLLAMILSGFGAPPPEPRW